MTRKTAERVQEINGDDADESPTSDLAFANVATARRNGFTFDEIRHMGVDYFMRLNLAIGESYERQAEALESKKKPRQYSDGGESLFFS